jgi:Tfp pilus assembly protein PilV
VSRLRAVFASRSSEAGLALPEVVVSAAVLALVAFAVLAGIDGAQSSTGREKSRSIAASLAEQDQERMRSMQADSLANYNPEPRTESVDGSTYTIESDGRWITDSDGGTTSCANNSKQADYLQITSRVTSKVVGTRVPPVVIHSIVAPSVAYSSTRGSLAVLVKNRNDVGVPDVAVSVTGPSTPAPETTNDVGCAIFNYLPEGNYTITLNRPGWVDKLGEQESVGNQDVVAGKLNIRTMIYDQAGVLDATVVTNWPLPNSTTTPVDLGSKAHKLSITNGAEPTLRRVFAHPIAGTPFGTLRLERLFPFTTPYNVHTGGCADSNPVNFVPSYFSTRNSRAVGPGATEAVTVRQPPFNIRVRNRNNTGYVDGATVRVDLDASSGCTDDQVFMTTMNPGGAAPYNTSGWVTKRSLVPTFDPGMPFGTYDLCIEYLDGTSWRRYRTTYVNGENGSTPHPNGRPGTLVLPPTSDSYDGGTASRRCGTPPVL